MSNSYYTKPTRVKKPVCLQWLTGGYALGGSRHQQVKLLINKIKNKSKLKVDLDEVKQLVIKNSKKTSKSYLLSEISFEISKFFKLFNKRRGYLW